MINSILQFIFVNKMLTAVVVAVIAMGSALAIVLPDGQGADGGQVVAIQGDTGDQRPKGGC